MENALVVENKELKHYNQMSGTFTIQYLQSSLSKKCDDLVKFQNRIVEQLDMIIQRLAHK